ncbi:S1 family peptidase [Salinibaculum rarum]|uniref:S1 family peptidase n=1 Tax=Salinibaculum rarum TaxID=3058903 RepID=UPI00265FD7C2|nr:serine protease [Salinibaculum sp. KK48]
MPGTPADSEHTNPRKESCEPREIPKEKVTAAENLLPDIRSGVAVVHPQRNGERVHGTGGTAWFLNDTYAITNQHVMRPSPSGEAKLWTTNQDSLTAEVVATGGLNRDIAVLEITDGTPPTTLNTADSSTLSKDDYIMLIGHPELIGYWVPSIGTYTGRNTFEDSESINPDYPDLNMNIPHTGGNSGSPVFTLDGDVVGMHWGSGFSGVGPAEHTPTSDVVHTEYPYQDRIPGVADPIEAIRETLSKVTQ